MVQDDKSFLISSSSQTTCDRQMNTAVNLKVKFLNQPTFPDSFLEMIFLSHDQTHTHTHVYKEYPIYIPYKQAVCLLQSSNLSFSLTVQKKKQD